MSKCNVANGFCPNYNEDKDTNCNDFDGHYAITKDLDLENIQTCKHRKRMNRLEKAFEDDDYVGAVGDQWEKEKRK